MFCYQLIWRFDTFCWRFAQIKTKTWFGVGPKHEVFLIRTIFRPFFIFGHFWLGNFANLRHGGTRRRNFANMWWKNCGKKREKSRHFTGKNFPKHLCVCIPLKRVKRWIPVLKSFDSLLFYWKKVMRLKPFKKTKQFWLWILIKVTWAS